MPEPRSRADPEPLRCPTAPPWGGCSSFHTAKVRALLASFDIVFAMYVLYHAQNPELAMLEIARVLRPHGIAIISTFG